MNPSGRGLPAGFGGSPPKSFNQPDYVDAGQRLLRQLGSNPTTGGGMRFSDLDCVYTHPTGGGRVYIGNLMAAQNLSILKGKNVTRVVRYNFSRFIFYDEE